MTILYVVCVWFLLFIGGGLVAVEVGWIADNDSPPAGLLFGWFGIECAGFVTFVVLAQRGNRLIKRHIRPLADGCPQEVPDTLQIGTAHLGVQTVSEVALPAVVLISLPIIRPGNSSIWLIAELVFAVYLIDFAWRGPSAPGVYISSAYVDSSGIRLPLLGIKVPWASIDGVRVEGAYHVALTIIGPVYPTGERPRRWTDRALAVHRPGAVVKVRTKRPELAVWVSRQHLNATRLATGQSPDTVS